MKQRIKCTASLTSLLTPLRLIRDTRICKAYETISVLFTLYTSYPHAKFEKKIK
jgi:hypothetical protein